jgi:hypothetical protein
MALTIEDDDGHEVCSVKCAPQAISDILVQVTRGPERVCILSFSIGQLMREELEGDGDWSGMLQVSDERAAVLLRWADQLEAYAQIMRSALKCRRPA